MADQLILDFDVEPEEWRVIRDWPNYEVSNTGRVRRTKPVVRRNPRNPTKIVIQRYAGFELSSFDKGNGYLYVQLSQDGRKAVMSIHVLVCTMFCAPPPSADHCFVAHWDGNPRNNAPSNLRWTTPKGNQEDMVRHGRSQRGEKQGHVKLTENDVRQIKRALADGESSRRIAARYGVVKSTIQWIKNGRNWYWLT